MFPFFVFLTILKENCLKYFTYSPKLVSGMEVAQADYTLGLLREAAGFSETMVLSPFSITSAFAVACLGADGNTKKEIHDLFAKGTVFDNSLFSFSLKYS